MLSSKKIKEAALAAGADICGIAPMSRFSGAPDEMNPQFLFPEAKSCVGFVFRIPRGVQRGIEEGTQFFQYPSMAYGGINEIFAPAVLYHVGKVIEDDGYEAFVYRNTGARGVVSDMDGTPGNTFSPEEKIDEEEPTAHHRSVQSTRPVREGNVAPDLQFQFRIAAVACGLGEIGWSKMLLTPEFGPLQRVAFLFTDGEFDEYDDIYSEADNLLEALGGEKQDVNAAVKIATHLSGKMKSMSGSVSKIAESMIQGSTMGVTKLIQHLNNYMGDERIKSIAKRLVQTEENNIETLKQYL